MTLELIALAGGLYVPLAFWHFVADWLTQTEKPRKSPKMGSDRPLLVYRRSSLTSSGSTGCTCSRVLAGLALFVSHLIGDTYLPVYWCVSTSADDLPPGFDSSGSCTRSGGSFRTSSVTGSSWTPLLLKPSLVGHRQL